MAPHPLAQNGDLVRLLCGGELQGGLAPRQQSVKELRCCQGGYELQPCQHLSIACICWSLTTILQYTSSTVREVQCIAPS